MPNGLGLAAALNNVGVVGGCLALVYLFVTDRIVSGRRLRRLEDDSKERLGRAEEDRDKWEEIALGAIRASSSAILPAAETVHRLVSNLPDPGADAEVEDGSQ